MSTQLEKVNEDISYTGPRASPINPNGGSYSVYGKSKINAPAQAVYKALIDISRWGEWNPIVPKVEVEKRAAAQSDLDLLHEGEVVILHAKMTRGSDKISKAKELIVQVGPLHVKGDNDASSPPARTIVRWGGLGFPSFVVKPEHVNWIDDNGDGTTTYHHWETFSGLAVPIIKAMYGKDLQTSWIEWAECLKTYVEAHQHELVEKQSDV